MDIRVVKAKDMFKPEEELIVISIGDITIIKKHKRMSEILEEISNKFNEMDEAKKEKMAIEAKKWVRERLRS